MNKYEELAKKYDGVKTKQLPNGIQFKKNKASVTIYPSTGTIVSDVCGKINVLKKAGIGKLDHEMNKHFSVITPKQKEYLVKTNTGYTLQVLSDVVDGHDGIIEVPDGAVALVTYDKNAGYWFNKENKFKGFGRVSNIGDFGKIDTLDDNDSYLDYSNAIGGCVTWQRKESLNDQVASAEKARQEQAQCKLQTVETNESDLVNAGQKILDGFTQPEELPFIDDEPTGVDGTLAERQSTYGDFEDVAQTTEQLFQVIKGGASFVDFTDEQRMALYMICSKIARLTNGDVNYIESWHDISGYATLIENSLSVTDGSTNARLVYQKVINGKLQDI